MAEQTDGAKREPANDDGSLPVVEQRTPGDPPRFSADDVRGGEIILRTRMRRLIFISGLVGIVLLALIVRIAGYW